MERVLGQLQWQICLCYLDNILEHLENLEKVFQRSREARLKLKPKKCHFLSMSSVVPGPHTEQGWHKYRLCQSPEDHGLSSSKGHPWGQKCPGVLLLLQAFYSPLQWDRQTHGQADRERKTFLYGMRNSRSPLMTSRKCWVKHPFSSILSQKESLYWTLTPVMKELAPSYHKSKMDKRRLLLMETRCCPRLNTIIASQDMSYW